MNTTKYLFKSVKDIYCIFVLFLGIIKKKTSRYEHLFIVQMNFIKQIKQTSLLMYISDG